MGALSLNLNTIKRLNIALVLILRGLLIGRTIGFQPNDFLNSQQHLKSLTTVIYSLSSMVHKSASFTQFKFPINFRFIFRDSRSVYFDALYSIIYVTAVKIMQKYKSSVTTQLNYGNIMES